MLVFFSVYKDHHHRKKENEIKAEREKLMRSLVQIRQAAAGQTVNPKVVTSGSIAETIKILQNEEEKNTQEQLKRIHYYDKGLETFLDIKCSWVKKRQQRLDLQDELLRKIGSDTNNVINYLELKDIFENDSIFCGNDKTSNGKLRQLYVQNWKLQVERDKYKNILDKLKQQLIN